MFYSLLGLLSAAVGHSSLAAKRAARSQEQRIRIKSGGIVAELVHAVTRKHIWRVGLHGTEKLALGDVRPV
jgi:hypothetical protein